MRSAALLLLLLAPRALPAQQFRVGIKAGTEQTERFEVPPLIPPFFYTGSFQRFIVGPVVEVSLPRQFAVDASVVRRRLGYGRSVVSRPEPQIVEQRRLDTKASLWDVPVVLKKYRTLTTRLSAYGEAGLGMRHVTGTTHIKGTRAEVLPPRGFTRVLNEFTAEEEPQELNSDRAAGFVIGAGVDLRIGLVHVQPGLRYTRWSSEPFRNPDGTLQSSRNSVDFQVGLMFSR